MSIDTAETELANEFASFTPEALKKHFDDLNEAIRAKAEPVKQNLCLLKSGVDDLVPHLAVMQSFLSQRGSARDKFRKAHLPTWTTWFKSFNKDTGLNVTLRAVQKQLANLRGAYKREKSDPPVKLSAKNQRRLLTVHQYANEIVAAVENSADCSEVMREYRRSPWIRSGLASCLSLQQLTMMPWNRLQRRCPSRLLRVSKLLP